MNNNFVSCLYAYLSYLISFLLATPHSKSCYVLDHNLSTEMVPDYMYTCVYVCQPVRWDSMHVTYCS